MKNYLNPSFTGETFYVYRCYICQATSARRSVPWQFWNRLTGGPAILLSPRVPIPSRLTDSAHGCAPGLTKLTARVSPHARR